MANPEQDQSTKIPTYFSQIDRELIAREARMRAGGGHHRNLSQRSPLCESSRHLSLPTTPKRVA